MDLENPDLENERVLEELIFRDEELVKQYLTPLALARFNPELFQAWLSREGRRMRQEQEQAAQSQALQQLMGQLGGAGGAPGGPPTIPGPPMPGMPPTPVPAPMGPVPFDAQAQAEGAATAGQEILPGIRLRR